MQTTPSKIVPVQMFKTTDGKIHPEADKARRHQVFLDVKHGIDDCMVSSTESAVYLAVMDLAKHYDFVPRNEGASVTVTVINQADKSVQLRKEVADHLHSLQRRGGYAP